MVWELVFLICSLHEPTRCTELLIEYSPPQVTEQRCDNRATELGTRFDSYNHGFEVKGYRCKRIDGSSIS